MLQYVILKSVMKEIFVSKHRLYKRAHANIPEYSTRCHFISHDKCLEPHRELLNLWCNDNFMMIKCLWKFRENDYTMYRWGNKLLM